MSKEASRRAMSVSAPVTEPKPGNKAKAPRPIKKRDRDDIERADSEGMAQPQALEPKPQKASKAKRKATEYEGVVAHAKSAKKRK
jgi:hypothetical protein